MQIIFLKISKGHSTHADIIGQPKLNKIIKFEKKLYVYELFGEDLYHK